MSPSHTAHAANCDASPILNIAAYRFVRLQELPDWRKKFRKVATQLGLLGTVLLSREGINLFVAGTAEQIQKFRQWLDQFPEFAGLEVKVSPGLDQPFNRMLVRLKKEIISMGVPEIDPVQAPSPKLDARTLCSWLDEGRAVTLLDTRNDYEIELGTFENALPIGITHFRQFPGAVRKLPEELKKQPIVMFCTGGIRCEKAGPLMEREGFEQVFQLDGGILKYFEECGGRHYAGDCFVFDKRVAVNPALEETTAAICFACQAVLTEELQADPRYQPPHSCPQCFRSPAEKMQERILRRQRALDESVKVLPGSIPYANHRPLNVPGACDRCNLLELLCQVHGHLGADYWKQEIGAGRLLSGGQRLFEDTKVRGGWRIEHLLPETVEPDVNAAIVLIHEDDDLVVVNKPAPLPMHPSGRFNRNSLVPILNSIYPNELLRPAHRLDANTTGVVLLSRSRAVARKIQPQFEQGMAEKVYLALTKGHPETDEFDCLEPITRTAGPVGSREIDSQGLPAETRFRVLVRLPDGNTLLECRPVTGRTNQIRIHLATLGLPIVGDPLYGNAESMTKTGIATMGGLPQILECGPPEVAGNMPDQEITGTLKLGDPPMCLHASSLSLIHPDSGTRIRFEAPPPAWALSHTTNLMPG